MGKFPLILVALSFTSSHLLSIAINAYFFVHSEPLTEAIVGTEKKQQNQLNTQWGNKNNTPIKRMVYCTHSTLKSYS